MDLTPKQERFVQGLVAGLSQRKAFIEAGYSSKGKTDNYLDVEASKLFKKPKVNQRYQDIINESKNKVLWNYDRAIEASLWMVNQSKKSILEQDEGYVRQGTANAYNAAVAELNKLTGLYPKDKVEGTVEEQLAEGLKNLGDLIVE